MNNQPTSRDPLGYYQIMGLTFAASDAEIKQNYRDKAKLWHPDHNAGAEATEKFQKLAVAYDVLKNPQMRLIYDLLSSAYTARNFPDMKALKAYKDRAGNENPFIRTFSLRRVVGKILTSKVQDSDEICSSAEAPAVVFKVSAANWFFGWWGITAFFKNLEAIRRNFSNINQNRRENLTLLLHNATAYYQDQKLDKALLSALQAQEYADNYTRSLIERFIRLLALQTPYRLPQWNYSKLRWLQLAIPGALLLVLLGGFSTRVVTENELWEMFARKKEITYYQEVRFNSGAETFDDRVVSKVMNLPVDLADQSYLFHLKSAAKIMYGPSDDFDVILELPAKSTLRVTGITPDQLWSRVMLDNGNSGFVHTDNLAKGIGLAIPENSKIYQLD